MSSGREIETQSKGIIIRPRNCRNSEKSKYQHSLSYLILYKLKMYLSYKSTFQQQRPSLYSSQYGSYVRLSSFAKIGDFRLEFDINLFGLSQSQVLKLVQVFAKEHGKTEELQRAFEFKKEKGGVRFVWGFLSLISGDTYDKGYNRSKVHINQSSSELEVLFYQRLFLLKAQKITVSGRGTTKSTQQTSVNFEILTIKEENTKKEVSIIFAPKTENFHQDNQANYQRQYNQPKYFRRCSLPPIYSAKNNFNLKLINSENFSDRFPTPQQASSIINNYQQNSQYTRKDTKISSFIQRGSMGLTNKIQYFNDKKYHSKIWPNGKTIKYFFMSQKQRQKYIQGYENIIVKVHQAFKTWKSTGINLSFEETKNIKESDIRISFVQLQSFPNRDNHGFHDQYSGSWSAVGTDAVIFEEFKDKASMNFGWDQVDTDGTILHEIGHAIGFYHEHQSPNCLIKWNIEQVKRIERQKGNYWSDREFEDNIFVKIPDGAAWSTDWDPKSIMHYDYQASEILQPQFQSINGIKRNTELSPTDIKAVRIIYPVWKEEQSILQTEQRQDAKNHANKSYNQFLLTLNKRHQKGKFEEKEIKDQEYLCALQDIYGQQNKFNLKPIQCKKASDAFPTQEQAKSIFNAYLKSLQKQTSQHKLSRRSMIQFSTFARPTQDQFKQSNKYKSKLWPIGTTITYCFLTSQKYHVVKTKQKELKYFPQWKQNVQYVRKAFKVWKDTGINLSFEQIPQPTEQNIKSANIRISFYEKFSNSYIGTDCLDIQTGRTMNIGWSIIEGKNSGTAIHEIGHALGLYHQHQNPACQIKWNRTKVLDKYKGPPNNWDENKINHNILNALPYGSATNSKWDPLSIMHYSFTPDLIEAPLPYAQTGTVKNTSLSQLDKQWILIAYPPSTSKVSSFQQIKIAQSEQEDKEQNNSEITFSKILTILKGLNSIYRAITTK